MHVVYWVNQKFKERNSIDTSPYTCPCIKICITICLLADGCILWQAWIWFYSSSQLPYWLKKGQILQKRALIATRLVGDSFYLLLGQVWITLFQDLKLFILFDMNECSVNLLLGQNIAITKAINFYSWISNLSLNPLKKKLSSALVGAFLSLFLALKCDVWQWDIVPILYEFATTKSPFFKLFSRLYCLECRAFEKKIIKNKGKSFDQFGWEEIEMHQKLRPHSG